MDNEIQVFYVVDLDTTVFDTYTITKCLHVFLQTTFRNHLFTRFQHVPFLPLSVANDIHTDDVIKRGLLQFCFMYETLKLKSSGTTWFIYISNGNVVVNGQSILENVGVLLLNQHPERKECIYTIHKTPFAVFKSDTREKRLEDLKTFSKTFRELFQSNKILKYSAVTNAVNSVTESVDKNGVVTQYITTGLPQEKAPSNLL